MSFGGTVSAMISSLKSNNSLRRNKHTYSRFYKKSVFGKSNTSPLSKEENLKIVEENKEQLKKKTIHKNIYGIIMVMLYLTIIGYMIMIFQM